MNVSLYPVSMVNVLTILMDMCAVVSLVFADWTVKVNEKGCAWTKMSYTFSNFQLCQTKLQHILSVIKS